jgi:hypothetical protein
MYYKTYKRLLPKKHIAGSLDLAVDFRYVCMVVFNDEEKHQVFGTVLGFV